MLLFLLHMLFYPTIPYLPTYSMAYSSMCTKTYAKVGSLHMFAIKTLRASKGNSLNYDTSIKFHIGYQNSYDKFICTHMERWPKTNWKTVYTALPNLLSFVIYVL